MPAPVVVVQGLPSAPELRSGVLSACSEALKYRSCIAPEEQERSAPPSATALISWSDSEGRRVRVTLERSDPAANHRVDREIHFADKDPVIERWRTVGLVIAALLGESEVPRDGAEKSNDRQSFSLEARSPPRAWLGLSGWVGPGLDDGSVRLGTALLGGAALSPPFFLEMSASYAVRPPGERRIDVRWTTLAVGGGAATRIPSVDLGLRLRVAVLLEYLHASSATGAAFSGGGSRTTPGILGGGDLLWPAKGPVGMTLGFSVWSLTGGTSIRIDQEKAASSRWLSYAGFLGVAWSFR